MDRNEQLSPSHEAYLAKGGGSGWILLAMLAVAVGYLVFTTGGVGGKAVVVALLVGGTVQLIRRLVRHHRSKA
ncbi:MAG TPA: hypothetical protein VFL81_03085 [Candidatus Saccharimonadales bacterium]|nr:hypothetical protein [Candidatus Saccharimonadales bacterium]